MTHYYYLRSILHSYFLNFLPKKTLFLFLDFIQDTTLNLVVMTMTISQTFLDFDDHDSLGDYWSDTL